MQNDGAEETGRAAAIETFLTVRRGDSSRVTLRPITGHDQDEFLELARASVDLHHPYHERWAITSTMTGHDPGDPHPTLPLR